MFSKLLQEEKIQVLAKGDDVLIRSGFSDTHDLVWRIFRYANEAAYLVHKDQELEDGIDNFYPTLHYGNDDYPAMSMENYVYLSGNHGSVASRFITAPGHPFGENSIGEVVLNEKGEEYIVVSVQDEDHFILHGIGKGDSAHPLFPKWEENTRLFYKGRELTYTQGAFTQIFPMNRITKYEFLIDGKFPLEKDKLYTCSTLEFHFDHDVLSPIHLADFLKENAGKSLAMPQIRQHARMCFVNTEELQNKYADYRKIPALLTQKNIFTFQPYASCTNKRNITFHLPLARVNALDIMQIWNGYLSELESEEFYIPKLKDFTLHYQDGSPDEVWKSNTLFPCKRKMRLNQILTKENDALDPTDPPDRYIRLAGSAPGKREFGFALGFSLLHGFTAKENKGLDRDELYFFYRSKKFYPRSYTFESVKPGTSVECCTYKHYFNPQAEPDATSFYYHKEGDSTLLYLDFHKVLSNKKIHLPASFAGKKISIVEKTPSVILHTENEIPCESAIMLDVTGDSGYIVLKLD